MSNGFANEILHDNYTTASKAQPGVRRRGQRRSEAVGADAIHRIAIAIPVPVLPVLLRIFAQKPPRRGIAVARLHVDQAAGFGVGCVA
jgi:hypothetical protein